MHALKFDGKQSTFKGGNAFRFFGVFFLFFFSLLHSEKRVYSEKKRKSLPTLGANSFLLEWTPIQKGVRLCNAGEQSVSNKRCLPCKKNGGKIYQTYQVPITLGMLGKKFQQTTF